MKLVQYFCCESFAEASPAQRLSELKKRKLCTQSLFPGTNSSTGKHADGSCQSTYVCNHESHNSHNSKLHVLLCKERKNDDANKAYWSSTWSRCITRENNIDIPIFFFVIWERQISYYLLLSENTGKQSTISCLLWNGIILKCSLVQMLLKCMIVKSPLEIEFSNDVPNTDYTSFLKSGRKLKDLPKLVDIKGGCVDIMIGVKYLRYFPK